MVVLDSQTLEQIGQKSAGPPALPDASLRLIKLLNDDDRLLLEMSWKMGLSLRQMGRLLHLTPGSVSRRIRRVQSRLLDPLTRDLGDPNAGLNSEQRAIGLDYFLHRFSIPQIAVRHQMSVAQVRAGIAYLRGWHRGFNAPR